MKALIWKECRENLKWAVLPMLLVGAIQALHPVPPSLMDYEFLQFLSFVAGVSGATVGFLQIFFESQGDRRAFLLHRPISRSQIFLGKTIAGVGLYLLAMGIPFACAAGWAATPGHVAAPFCWAMTLPWLADILTGVVYYFAGMLAAQREARWYGSRCLGLAAACLCSFFVCALPEFWQAVLAILIMGGLAAVAAWDSFLAGGAYSPQPRLAKTALAVTFLAGLLFLSVTAKLLVGAFLDSDIKERYTLDREGRLLIVHSERGKSPSVVDSEGREPQKLEGKGLDHQDIFHAIKELEAPASGNVWPTFHGYRNPGRFCVPYQNDSSLSGERWFYVPDLGRLLGYDRQSKRLIGSFGPDGFVPADQQPRQQFEGELCNYFTYFFEVGPVAYLHFPDAVYTVDFGQRTIRILFAPGEDETVLWAIQWKDKKKKLSPAVVGTNKSVYIVDEAGSLTFAAPLVHDQKNYGLVRVGRLEDPERFVIWYEPSWRLGTEGVKTLPSYLVEYDAAGREIARRTVPHRPLIESPLTQALFGLVTPPPEAAVFVGATQDFVSEGKLEVSPLAFIFLEITQYFIPGAGLDKTVAEGTLLTFWALILLSAVAAALVCFLLARRNSFSRGRCIGWALCGLVFGPTGLLLMLALQEWPARITCHSCNKPRLVTSACCEHCAAPHAAPAPDGTEIFEPTVAVVADLSLRLRAGG